MTGGVAGRESEGVVDVTHVVLMGVAGSGKTTLALELRRRLGWPYAEADDFHPPANIDKMSAGTPLTDEDRWPWLAAIRDWLTQEARAGRSTVLWSKIGFQHTLPGNYTNEPALDTNTNYAIAQDRHDLPAQDVELLQHRLERHSGGHQSKYRGLEERQRPAQGDERAVCVAQVGEGGGVAVAAGAERSAAWPPGVTPSGITAVEGLG